MSLQTKASISSFGGKLLQLTHHASTTQCEMAFHLYLPPQPNTNTSSKIPLLIYLAGFTCTPDNGPEKGFFQHAASKEGIAVLYPDTSPRGLNIPGEDDDYDFGVGAGFYVDATRAPWSEAYNMYSYITRELPEAVFAGFEQIDSERVSIMGHSMGGHGALALFFKNPQKYKSASAFAPIANPSLSAWGQKAFSGYFGPQETEHQKWAEYDATELVKTWRERGGKEIINVLIDIGTEDNFHAQNQLLPQNLADAASSAGINGVQIRMQEGYDHSYYFVASFADQHVEYAARFLKA